MKKLKGFTLIEMIVVMAIFTGVLTAILQLMDPVTAAFNDSTVYESQRTVENGIISYITENVRYANKVTVCDQNVTTSNYMYNGSPKSMTISDEAKAVQYFCEKNNIDMSKSEEMEKIQVIRIDRSTSYDGSFGRLIRRNGWNPSKSSFSGSMSESVVNTYDTKELYMAMGSAYYNHQSYIITIPNLKSKYIHYDALGEPIPDSDDNVDNSTQLPKGFDVVVSTYNSGKSISTQTQGSVTLMNYRIKVCDIDYQTSSEEYFGDPKGSSGNLDTYIVFTRPN